MRCIIQGIAHDSIFFVFVPTLRCRKVHFINVAVQQCDVLCYCAVPCHSVQYSDKLQHVCIYHSLAAVQCEWDTKKTIFLCVLVVTGVLQCSTTPVTALCVNWPLVLTSACSLHLCDWFLKPILKGPLSLSHLAGNAGKYKYISCWCMRPNIIY